MTKSDGNWQNRIVGYGEEAPDQLLANPLNFRIHPKDQQEATEGSLDSLGWIDDVIINKTTGHVVDGHLRVTLALRHGAKTVPVKYVELTEDEERQALLSLDTIAAMAATDKAKLDELIHGIQSDNEQVQKYIEELAKREGIQYGTPPEDPGAQIDKAEELRKKWGVESGQLWKLGEHRLICGDCTDRAVVERVMQGEKAGAVVTDPPYGLGDTKSFNNNHQDYKDDEPFDLTLLDLSYFFVIWGGQYYDWIPEPRNKIGWIVWDKRPDLEGDKRDRADRIFGQHFEIAVTNIGDLRGKMYRQRWGGYYGSQEIFHKTQKPPELFEWCIKPTEGVIMDYFLGSGTTLIACERLHRKCRAVEISPVYCAVAIQRWVDMTQGIPELIDA